jgi:hypothetical protein
VRTDTFRASGAGGQHINKTDSAVRLTHIPTGIVVQCQDGRSQHSNRDVAWKRLRSRLYDFEMRKRQEAQQKLEDSKTDVGWGHQIRSYVLDNSRIKDLRTNVEVSATQKVLDGDLDVFIEASLKQGVYGPKAPSDEPDADSTGRSPHLRHGRHHDRLHALACRAVGEFARATASNARRADLLRAPPAAPASNACASCSSAS